jgi:hypothetical protein
MDPISGIGSSSLLASLYASGAIAPATALRATGAGFSSNVFFSDPSTSVELSGLGRLLSAATRYQDHLQALQPGSATSGGGTNFGTDFASLAAEAQSFVDAFNGLKGIVADVETTNSLSGGNLAFARGLSQSLDAQTQVAYANGGSALTGLSQLGIEFQPSPFAGGGGRLSLDLDALRSAFDADAEGAFSLLSKAADAFGELGGNIAAEGSRQYSSVAALAQLSSSTTFLGGGLFSPTQGSSDLFGNLLLAGALTGGANIQQTVRAISQYTLVANLFG